MDDPRLYLALDQGGHASRAIVFDAAGQSVASAEHPISTQRNGVDLVEHVADEVASSIKHVLNDVQAALGSRRMAHVVAVGLATQRSSIVCWNKRTGAPLSPVISWQDTRAAARLAGWVSRRAAIHQTTGMFPSAHYGASKLAWCVEHIDAVKCAADAGELACGPLASFLAVQLCGPQAAVVDPANAGRTLLWSIANGDWDDALLSEFSLQRSWLPRCVSTVGDFGPVEALPGHPPLRAINGDQSAALFADGIPKSGDIFLNAGTGAFIQHPRSERPQGVERLPVSVVLKDQQRVIYAVEGTINGAAAALDWVAEVEGLEHWQASAARWLDEVRSPPLFVNGIGGLGSPFWVSPLASRFIGEGAGPARWVAAVESIVFLARANLDEVRASAQVTTRLVISGGLAMMDGFCQRVANLCAMVVVRPANKEATARGIACLLRPGYYWEASPTGAAADTLFTPKTDRLLEGRYAAWREQIQRIVEQN